jgi:hypothetical protein
MPAGSCPRCGRAYTAGEVTGLGILRPRPEERGGPWMEFPCPGCRAVLRLLPHGNGRYAVPGEPPPPAPDLLERRMPWGQRGVPAEEQGGGPPPRRETAATPAPAAAAPAPTPPAPRREDAGPRTAGAPPAKAPPEAAEGPLDFASAERLLKLLPGYTAADVERAFRRRALLCHPDKVAHLDEDFQALAAKKFKRLKEARDLLGGA